MARYSIYDLTPISTTSGLWSTGNTRKYQQIDIYIYQCGPEPSVLNASSVLNESGWTVWCCTWKFILWQSKMAILAFLCWSGCTCPSEHTTKALSICFVTTSLKYPISAYFTWFIFRSTSLELNKSNINSFYTKSIEDKRTCIDLSEEIF